MTGSVTNHTESRFVSQNFKLSRLELLNKLHGDQSYFEIPFYLENLWCTFFLLALRALK